MRIKLFCYLLVFGILAIAGTANAQVPVIDGANLAQNITTAAQEVIAVEQLKSQLQQLENTYTMFTNPTNILGMATGMENQVIENPMPTANALAGLVGGQTSATGSASTFYQQNHIYSPTDGSADSQRLISNGQSIDNIMGMAETNLQAIQTRLADLPDLEADLNAAGNITNLSAIRGRIESEESFVQGQQVQAANLQVLASEQQQVQAQQAQELQQQDYSNFQTRRRPRLATRSSGKRGGFHECNDDQDPRRLRRSCRRRDCAGRHQGWTKCDGSIWFNGRRHPRENPFVGLVSGTPGRFEGRRAAVRWKCVNHLRCSLPKREGGSWGNRQQQFSNSSSAGSEIQQLA
jgi:conjugal transfer/entry exclusion protein